MNTQQDNQNNDQSGNQPGNTPADQGVPQAPAQAPAQPAGQPANPAGAVAAGLITTMTPGQVSEAIKAAGCSVTAFENEGVTHLHSASQGVGFQVLWGSLAAPGEYADFTLSCPLRIRGGTLPPETLAEWHRTRRFARMAQHGDFVVLEMDVLAAGGISVNHLAVMLRLWTQMMGWFLLHLRNFEPPVAGTAAGNEKAGPAAGGASMPATETAGAGAE